MHIITMEHWISTGHRIMGHQGKCRYLHGHNYRFDLTVGADELIEPGFVIDFGHIKAILDEWDHRFLLWDEDPIMVDMLERIGTTKTIEWGFIATDWNPTVENMVVAASETVVKEIVATNRKGYCDMTIWETEKASAYNRATT